MREIHRSIGAAPALAAPSEAQRPQLPHELNEKPEPSRHVPAAGIVEVKPTAERSPFLQYDPQFARIEERPDKRLRHIQQARTTFNRGQSHLRLVDDQAPWYIDFNLLFTALEFPSINPLIARSDTHASLSLQVTGVLRDTKSFKVGGRPYHDPADIGGEALGDHVFRHRSAVANAGIEPAVDDVHHTVADRYL